MGLLIKCSDIEDLSIDFEFARLIVFGSLLIYSFTQFGMC